jgi:hypothetical protein
MQVLHRIETPQDAERIPRGSSDGMWMPWAHVKQNLPPLLRCHARKIDPSVLPRRRVRPISVWSVG